MVGVEVWGVSPDGAATGADLGGSSKYSNEIHLRLNTDTSPIADKYREGKLKRTLKREFKSTCLTQSECWWYTLYMQVK